MTGVVLLLSALFVAQHEHFTSVTTFHPQEPRFGIQVTSVEFADYGTKVDLKVIDTDTSDYTKQFSKFYPPFDFGKALVYVNGDRRWPVHLLRIAPPLEEFQKLHTGSISHEDTIVLMFEKIADPEQQNSLILQFLDFPELEIHTHNAELVKIPILRSIPSNILFVLAFMLLGFGILGMARDRRESRTPVAPHVSQVIMPPPEPTSQEPKPQKTEDELKMEEALLRAKRDAQFATMLRMAKKLHTIEAIQEWQNEESRKVRKDTKLTPKEKKERLEQIDMAASEEKQRLKDNASIYEED